ncbi:hypothetical protein CABS01_10195 [Colletotrichum abscissum]|nr:uncharacterized protein CABS01_10195 [Colletotrichum abscissum]KAK1499797.1 hypothetical protein CABS01_10195 [Colletotrichum abscissum]
MDDASKDATSQPSPVSEVTQLAYMPDVVVLNIVDMLLNDGDIPGYLESDEERYDVCTAANPEGMRSWGVQNATNLAKVCMRFYNIVSPAVFRHDIQHRCASSLLLSAKRNNLDGVLASLRHGANINQTDQSLMHVEETEIMEEHRFECLLFPVKTSLTALHWASLYGYKELVHHLLKFGADVQHRADLGFYHYFSCDPYENCWKEYETDMDDPHRALFCATKAEYKKSIDRSSAQSQRETLPSPMGANPLFFALRGSFDSENRALWEATSTEYYRFGTEPFVADDISGSRLDIVKALIKAGSSLVTREKDKVHALHQACAYRDVDVVRFLLEEVGVDPNTRDSKGDTALHYVAANQSYTFIIDAASHRHDLLQRTQEIVNLLIDKGSNINAQNIDGQSPADIGLYARPERESWAPGGSYGPSRSCI